MEYAAVIFDMDGLMLDTEKLAYEAWRQAASDFGCMLEEETYYALVGKAIPVIENSIAQALGSNFNIQEARKLKQQYFINHITEKGIPIKAGLMELLDFIDMHSIVKAVASSTDRKSVIQRLTLTGLVERFDVIACGDEVQNGKPAPDIFLITANQLNVEPHKCIVLEDSDAGIRAAHAAGMIAMMVPDKKGPEKETQAITNKIFPSLIEVTTYLKTI